MKKTPKVLLTAGGAALICGGSVMTYLKAQTPMTSQDELTLANIEAMALNLGPDMDQGFLNGPQKKYDCPGWWTGKGYRCAAEIQTICSQILCK